MALVTVKNKYQIVIPQAVRKQIRVNIGDLLEAKSEKGKIILTPQAIFDKELMSHIAESKADYKAGRYYGPFETAKEAVRFLKADIKKRNKAKK